MRAQWNQKAFNYTCFQGSVLVFYAKTWEKIWALFHPDDEILKKQYASRSGVRQGSAFNQFEGISSQLKTKQKQQNAVTQSTIAVKI